MNTPLARGSERHLPPVATPFDAELLPTNADVDQLLATPKEERATATPAEGRVFVPTPGRPWLRGIAVVLLRPPHNLLLGIADYLYDFWRFTRFSSSVATRYDAGQLTALINEHYRNVEKGLALPTPRPGFG